MITKNFKHLILAALALLAFTSCNNETTNIDSDSVSDVNLPSKINIVSTQELPQGFYISKLRDTETYSLKEMIKKIDDTMVFNGSLDSVVMNGKKKDPADDVPVKIKRKSDTTFGFNMYVKKKGHMPADLEVQVDNLTLNDDGTFEAYNVPKLTIKMAWGLDYPVTKIKGHFEKVRDKITNQLRGYNIKVEIESRGTFFKIEIFKAEVGYTGSTI